MKDLFIILAILNSIGAIITGYMTCKFGFYDHPKEIKRQRENLEHLF